MKTRIIFSAFLFLVSCHIQAQGIECGNRFIYAFDLEVTGFNPHTYYKIVELEKDENGPVDGPLRRQFAQWRTLNYANEAYYMNIKRSESPDERFVFSKGPQNSSPSVSYNKLCYGSPTKNFSYNWGDFTNTVSFAQLPPPPFSEMLDYIIYGTVTNEERSTESQLQIKCINFRENQTIYERWDPINSSELAYQVIESASKEMISHLVNTRIAEYEKNKRDKSNEEDNGEVAIEPKLEFDQASYKIEYESIYDRAEKITISLKDCDGEPLKNRVIKVEVKKGLILEKEVKTDEDGEAEITYLAPENSCTDQIHASWRFKYPSGRTNKATKSASIKVIAPVKKIVAQITINTHSSSYSPSKEEPRQSTTLNYVITGELACEIMRSRIIMYNDTPERRSECDAGDHCPILYGSSQDIVRDPNDVTKIVKDERYPLYVGRDYTEMGYRYVGNQEKYVRTIDSKAEGANTVEAIQLEIKAYVGAEGALPSLVPQYVIWLNGAMYLDKLRIHPEGNGSNMGWDDFKEKLVPTNNPNFIGIPYTISDADISLNENQVYDQLIIKDVKGLDDYLLKPVGSYTITASGNRTTKDESFESEGTIKVTITFNPAPEEKDPDWDNW